MAKDPQNPLDDELERHDQDDAQTPEGEAVSEQHQAEERLAESELGSLIDDEGDTVNTESESDNPEAEVLATRVEELEKALEETKEQSMRTAAEAQNMRRRAEHDAEKSRKFALEKFVKELLPVVDSLEKALEAMGEEATEAHREGVSMTLKMQLDVLGKFGVESVDPHGEPFDPQLHEAMTMVPNPDMDPNTVMEVIQKGYQLNGRLIRPAMVVVSKKPD